MSGSVDWTRLSFADAAALGQARLAARSRGEPMPATLADVHSAKHLHEDALEKEEQHEVYKLFRALGLRVRNLSQARETKQDPGLGDAWVTAVDDGFAYAFWWESKRQKGGRFSTAQLEMREECARAGIPYHSGGVKEAEQLLIQIGWAIALPEGGLMRARRRLSVSREENGHVV